MAAANEPIAGNSGRKATACSEVVAGRGEDPGSEGQLSMNGQLHGAGMVQLKTVPDGGVVMKEGKLLDGASCHDAHEGQFEAMRSNADHLGHADAVSYTHLTLPTICSV